MIAREPSAVHSFNVRDATKKNTSFRQRAIDVLLRKRRVLVIVKLATAHETSISIIAKDCCEVQKIPSHIANYEKLNILHSIIYINFYSDFDFIFRFY
jgi:hypothetical protein